jgi:hypothetical protein
MRGLPALGACLLLSCSGRADQPATRAAMPEARAPEPGITLLIGRERAVDVYDPDRAGRGRPAPAFGEQAFGDRAFIDQRLHVEPEPGSHRVRLTGQDFLDPAPIGLQVFLVRADGRTELLSAIDFRSPALPLIGDRVRLRLRDDDPESPERIGWLRAIEPEELALEMSSAPDAGSPGPQASAGTDAWMRFPRATVLDMRALDVAAEARFELPPDAGARPLVRLVYQSDSLSWYGVFYIAPADGESAPTGPSTGPPTALSDNDSRDIRPRSTFMLAVRAWFVVENDTGRALPEARVRLYDSPERAWRASQTASQIAGQTDRLARANQAAKSDTAFGAPVYDGRLALAEQTEYIELATHEPAIPGRLEHVVRLEGDSAVHRMTRDLSVEVRRELVLAPPPGHALHASAPGWTRISLPKGGPWFEVDEEFPFYDQPAGTWRAYLGVSPGVHATARVSLRRAPEGAYARYRLTVQGQETSPGSVHVIADIADAGMAELLSVEPAPVARDEASLRFQLELAEPDWAGHIEYLVFYPQ